MTRGARTFIFLIGIILFVVLNEFILPTFWTFNLGNFIPYAVVNIVFIFIFMALLSRQTEEPNDQ